MMLKIECLVAYGMQGSRMFAAVCARKRRTDNDHELFNVRASVHGESKCLHIYSNVVSYV